MMRILVEGDLGKHQIIFDPTYGSGKELEPEIIADRAAREVAAHLEVLAIINRRDGKPYDKEDAA